MSTTPSAPLCEWDEKYIISQESLRATTGVTIFIGVMAVLGNSFVLLAIYKSANLQKIPMYLLGSLAVVDAAVGMVIVPLYSVASLTWPLLLTNHTFEMFLDFLALQTLMASAFSLILVTYDRFKSIIAPMRYSVWVSNAKCFAAIAIVWVASFVLAAVSFALTGYETRPKFYLFVVLVAFVIPFMLIIYMYHRIFKVAASQFRRQMNARVASSAVSVTKSSDSESSRREVLRNKKASVSIAIIIGVFLACWLPNLVIGVIHFVQSEIDHCTAELTEQLWLLTLPFAFTNSALNPIIYCIRYKDFRIAFKSIFKL
ncbi:adenosine receptor A2a-like [Nematostella vectensis]|uniref:adenosine receptor A2a-like n=1 Tax=Nematostella vectensis TaxID=45351 RepID=UPI0013900CF0|nr:adenosine receptor A2a-like [Nematostella vectensis]